MAHDDMIESVDPGDRKVQGFVSEFSNGVFAFAITLLILDVALPATTAKEDLASALAALWPNYLAFFISFVIIGLFWSVYIRLLRDIVRADHRFIMLNLAFLLFIVVIPFSTSLMSVYLGELSVIIYAALMACAGYMHTVLRIYAGTNNRLITTKYNSSDIKKGILLSLVVPVWFTLSIGIAVFSVLAAQISWGVVFIAYTVIAHRYRDRFFL